MFPWNDSSLKTLWQGTLNTDDNLAQWKAMIAQFWDAVAVGAERSVYIYFASKRKAPLTIKLPPDNQQLLDADEMCVEWSLSHFAPFEPVVAFSRGSLLYLWNPIRMGMAGYLRGHGGAITSIAVHPNTPHLVCSTSRDLTTRIYDLSLPAEVPMKQKPQRPGKKKRPEKEKVPNPVWPPGKTPSLAGAAHGLRIPSEAGGEGVGAGRCIVVLLGGRSGGHKAAVLGAAFHPVHPIIATCGMDRTVKIWPVRPKNRSEIQREDKPLFTSGHIHKARVLSVSWLQDDLLLTHSAPAIMRVAPEDPNNKATYLEPGELIIWRWLGLNRFFPPGYEDTLPLVLRGCSSDYQESSSFKLISIHRFSATDTQYVVPKLSLFNSPFGDPLALFAYPGATSFFIVNIANLSCKPRPPFPLDAPKNNGSSELARAAERLHLDGQQEPTAQTETEAEAETEKVGANLYNGRNEVIPPALVSWEISVRECEWDQSSGDLLRGQVDEGMFWVWRYDDDEQK
ncbi:hypothetical protein NLJ89_g6071 [Agrocybe chaxingu]|uniref:WD40 repeat-like protein n=1 Tax=Agrocybe chaxingu TaxID=84603 RepID=A0A9W8K013_9AGAR|nr:hypothetical protein NLJ89_g6071 [Agrocybe chaxingu]